MHTILQYVTDRVTSRRGMWITLGVWLAITVLLSALAPGSAEYKSSSIDSIPADAPSMIAQDKVDQYFQDHEGMPAILVFQSGATDRVAGDQSTSGQSSGSPIDVSRLQPFFAEISQIRGVKEFVPLPDLPEQAAAAFFSADRSTAMIPLTFNTDMEKEELGTSLDDIQKLATDTTGLTMYVTGPAGIAVDTLEIFSRADLVLIFATVFLVLILLIIIYRSPLLALIPLLAVAFVYQVVNQVLGMMGQAGLLLNSQTMSIMTILLFAAVTDYSLFVFSRYREELKNHAIKYDAMKFAMRETGLPVFFSGGTVLVAMLVLFFAEFGDYRNFAPIFGTAVAVIMIASVTLVPALFTLFGRKSFWPKTPKVGDEHVKAGSIWSRVGRFVVRKPVVAVAVMGVILLASALNLFNLTYEFDTMKSFPKDMPSRLGYEALQENFEKGDLAPATVLFESPVPVTPEQQTALLAALVAEPLVGHVRVNDTTEDQKVIQYRVTYAENPYDVKTMDALVAMRNHADQLLADNGLSGKLYIAGETAVKADDRATNNRDLIVIVILETLLILAMLVILTRSLRMSVYMIGTILVSFLAAVGLGLFLSGLFFDIHTLSNRVPIYSFVFLVALGIDYNIILISRFIEERAKHPVKEAVQIAVSTTGGVISSAGIILAATFAVLMTQPVEVLFVFGFIVAVGIQMDTFLIRGVLLPALLVLFERDKAEPAKQVL